MISMNQQVNQHTSESVLDAAFVRNLVRLMDSDAVNRAAEAHHAPLASNDEVKYSWADASAMATRFQEVKRAAIAEAETFDLTEEQAEDYGQVTAWLDKEARQGTLRVVRCFKDGGRIARHNVLLLEETDDGEVVSTDIGGYVSMAELKRGAHGGTNWLYEKEQVEAGWVRIEVMITDRFPDHPMFKRSDGSRIDLGFNDDEHFYFFTVTIRQEDLVDTF
jgi:hypothetical protein